MCHHKRAEKMSTTGRGRGITGRWSQRWSCFMKMLKLHLHVCRTMSAKEETVKCLWCPKCIKVMVALPASKMLRYQDQKGKPCLELCSLGELEFLTCWYQRESSQMVSTKMPFLGTKSYLDLMMNRGCPSAWSSARSGSQSMTRQF